MRNQSCSISGRGSAIEDRNRNTNSTGNSPCTASPLPNRNAANTPMQPKAKLIEHRQRQDHEHAGHARPRAWRPPPGPTAMKIERLEHAQRHRARQLARHQGARRSSA